MAATKSNILMEASGLSKVFVYWIKERGSFSVVSESAVQGEILPGKKTVTKFQGKLYPSLIIASKSTCGLET